MEVQYQPFCISFYIYKQFEKRISQSIWSKLSFSNSTIIASIRTVSRGAVLVESTCPAPMSLCIDRESTFRFCATNKLLTRINAHNAHVRVTKTPILIGNSPARHSKFRPNLGSNAKTWIVNYVHEPRSKEIVTLFYGFQQNTHCCKGFTEKT